jgi:hypothetical protein
MMTSEHSEVIILHAGKANVVLSLFTHSCPAAYEQATELYKRQSPANGEENQVLPEVLNNMAAMYHMQGINHYVHCMCQVIIF